MSTELISVSFQNKKYETEINTKLYLFIWTEDSPLKKTKAMKRLFYGGAIGCSLLVLGALNFSCSGPTVDVKAEREKFDIEKGILYFEHELFSGTAVKYHADGEIEESCEYDEGKKNGEYSEYYRNPKGQIKEEGNFVDNEKDGKWTKYYENGKVELAKVFVAGKYDGKYESFYDNGQLKYTVTYKLGEKSGIEKSFFENGKLEEISVYKSGQKQGICKTFFDNGKLRSIGNYINGNRAGIYKEFDQQGKLTYSSKY